MHPSWRQTGASTHPTASPRRIVGPIAPPQGINRLHNLAIAYGTRIELATTGGGDDRITGNRANNVLTGNGGRDTLSGDSGHDIFYGGPGADRMYGGAGHDWARYDDSASGVTVNLATGRGSGGFAT